MSTDRVDASLTFWFDKGILVTYMNTEQKLKATDFFTGHPVFSLDEAATALMPEGKRLRVVKRLKHHLRTGRLKRVTRERSEKRRRCPCRLRHIVTRKADRGKSLSDILYENPPKPPLGKGDFIIRCARTGHGSILRFLSLLWLCDGRSHECFTGEASHRNRQRRYRPTQSSACPLSPGQ